MLGEYGTVLTEHIGASEVSLGSEDLPDKDVHDRDLNWLRSCDCLVAEVTRPSLGVGYEIGKATEWGKRVLCLVRPSVTPSLSAMIGGSGVAVREYEEVAEVREILREFFTSEEITK
jgi:hypothetical protein